MKLNNLEFAFDVFASEMAKLKNEKHFDYLITIIGEDFGPEEGLGSIYIIENTDSHERISVKMLAKKVGEDYVITFSAYYISYSHSHILRIKEIHSWIYY